MWSEQMVIFFPGFYIKLCIICTVQMAICIELYTFNPETRLCMYNYTLYIIREFCDVIIQKTKICHGQTFI